MPSSVTSPLATRNSGTQLILNVNQFPADASVLRLILTRPSWPGVPADNIIDALIKFNIGGEATFQVSGGTVVGPGGVLTESTLSIGVPLGAIEGPGGQIIPTKKAVQTGQAVIVFNQTLDSEITLEVV